jgi:hypothetical protein
LRSMKLMRTEKLLTRRACLSRLAGGAACLPAMAATSTGRVKITGFDIHKVSLRWRDLLFVEVKTDAGLTASARVRWKAAKTLSRQNCAGSSQAT